MKGPIGTDSNANVHIVGVSPTNLDDAAIMVQILRNKE